MPGSVPNEEGLRSLGREVDHDALERSRPSRAAGRGGRDGRGEHGTPRQRPAGNRRRRRRLRWTLLVVAVVLLAMVGTVAGYSWHLDHEVHRVAVKGLTAGPSAGADAGTENILMVGSTSRCALQVQNPAYGLCTKGVTGVNSDVVMVLHLDGANKAVSVLSIPRDLFVPNARTSGANKIDAALAQGPSQLVATIEEDFGIPIQHYVELNFDTFADVVTALGGITMDFPMPVFDAYSGLNIHTAGCQHLNGIEALQVVRARHLQYKGNSTSSTPGNWPHETQSDLARIRRDHEFLRVLASTVAARGLGSPGTDLSLVNAVAPKLTVDTALGSAHMVSLVLTFHSVTVNKAPQLTLPVRVAQFNGYHYKGGTYGDIEFPTAAQDQTVIDQFLGLNAGTDTMTGTPLPAPSTVSVSVLNGSGVENQATDTGQSLSNLGFHVVGVGDATPVGAEAETVVTYSARTPADEAAAQLVARSLSGSVIMAYGPTTGGADVTVTTGTDFSVNATAPQPAPSATSATNGHGATSGTRSTTPAAGASTASGRSTSATTSPHATTSAASAGATSSTASTSGPFATASPAVQPLQPWDPRACPPGSGGG